MQDEVRPVTQGRRSEALKTRHVALEFTAAWRAAALAESKEHSSLHMK